MSIFKFPLKMHVGEACKPIVEEGQKVKRGECIAEPTKGLGAKIHSSINGEVFKITDSEIMILCDSEQKEGYVRIKECNNIVDAVFEAGVVGAGGAGFPTHIKLKPEIPDGYIVANCAECEPLLEHNIRLLEENPKIVIKGIKYAMEATKAKGAYIGIKAKNKRAIDSIEKEIYGIDNIRIKKLKDIYPMGEERALIHEIFGMWLEPTELPLAAKSVVLNTETLANITRAVEDRKPVIDKDITVAGNIKGIGESKVFFQVPIGTPVKELIDNCGGIDGKYGELVIGGPYTGKAEELDKASVTKISGGAIVTIELPEFKGNLGLLVCACGANEERLRDLAGKMKSNVVKVVQCKNIVNVKGANKCKTPGDCPGQAAVILELKKAGADRVLISNCSDCSNTVMNCGPKAGLAVYHHTDHIFRTVNHKLTRRL
ncbi:proline reductase-associated electron transfer protein PrdC [Clostridium faecium]|uniref:Proline reductase-associated electron transfer protein PrdC n=1 Tax=Clostridium faecium TaxID=2762223 RepID=A0ABR8YN67_9CLOT|nr:MULTISPECIES: proline reductase-associated electron transfer protein PrdC [Clostridium]MBD8045664.1 proline reductase-associated electron transfer protein PrdC [Clostridium faecium]MDU1350876.1 proline reductase-associated electron transfer protein PrdC [Clostridium argentinense]